MSTSSSSAWGLASYDSLRLCSQIRALERTRNLPILLIADVEDRPRVLRGMELGVNDWLSRPVDRNELLARVRTQLRQKRYADSLREKVQQSIELALFDPLTGLNNRRFLENHLSTMIENARMRRAPLTLMILDIDHFKRVNDTYGHDCGDEVLKGFADRLRGIIRGGDLLCRLGGEEFVIVMPGVKVSAAARIAERARQAIEQEPFVMPRRAEHRHHRLDRPRRPPRRHQSARALPPRGSGALSLQIGRSQPRDSGRGLSLPRVLLERARVHAVSDVYWRHQYDCDPRGSRSPSADGSGTRRMERALPRRASRTLPRISLASRLRPRQRHRHDGNIGGSPRESRGPSPWLSFVYLRVLKLNSSTSMLIAKPGSAPTRPKPISPVWSKSSASSPIFRASDKTRPSSEKDTGGFASKRTSYSIAKSREGC